MITIRIFVIAFVVFLGIGLHAQDQEELVKEVQILSDFFSNNSNLAYNARYLLYDDLISTDPSAEVVIDFRTSSQQFYCHFENSEVYKMGKEVALVDHDNKQINLTSQEVVGEVQPTTDLAQMIEWIEFLDLIGEKFYIDDHNEGIRFVSRTNTKSIIEVIYNPKTKLLSKSYFALDLSNYTEKQREALDFDFDQKKLEVHYFDIQMENISFPNHLKKIIETKGKSISGRYAEYEVIEF